MKNKLKNVFLTLVFALSLPMMMFLSACGATPSSTITGVLFDSPIYDKEGTSVFEVDLGVSSDLVYKVYPSTASGYKVYFDPIDKGTAGNSLKFKFKDGNITVNAEDFEDVKYKVRVGEFSDTCIVRLKKYPTSISTSKTNVVLNSDGIQDIVIKGNFTNVDGTVRKNVAIDDSEYKFLVESSDETVVSIPNENRLKFIAVRKNGVGTAKVTATILNASGEKTDLKVEIHVKVVQNIADCSILVSGCEEFIENNSDVEINYNNLETDGGYKVISIKVYPENTNGELCVDDNYTINITTVAGYVTVSEDGKELRINGSVPNGYEFTAKIFFPDLKFKDSETGDTSEFMVILDFKIVK